VGGSGASDLAERTEEVLAGDDTEEGAGAVDHGESVDVPIRVGQEREHLVDVGVRPDGDDVVITSAIGRPAFRARSRPRSSSSHERSTA
jgi:hypothetical protein